MQDVFHQQYDLRCINSMSLLACFSPTASGNNKQLSKVIAGIFNDDVEVAQIRSLEIGDGVY